MFKKYIIFILSIFLCYFSLSAEAKVKKSGYGKKYYTSKQYVTHSEKYVKASSKKRVN